MSGGVQLSGGLSLDEGVRREPGAAIDPILLERLGLKVGDRLSLGTIEVPIRATIAAEPDKLVERLTVGPRVLVSLETLQRAGLVDPGSLVTWRYALKLAEAAVHPDSGPTAASRPSATGSSSRCPRAASRFATGAIRPRKSRRRSSGCASSSLSSV